MDRSVWTLIVFKWMAKKNSLFYWVFIAYLGRRVQTPSARLIWN